MKFRGSAGEYFTAQELNADTSAILLERIPSELTLFWATKPGNEFIIDGRRIQLKVDTLVCLTEFHQIEILSFSRGKMLRFNRDFYCILKHDDEVSCKGLLFFGASELPLIPLDETYKKSLSALWVVIETEISTTDELQLEMLQMLAKRFLILATRAYKENADFENLNVDQVDLIRSFNFLVEQHFREKHKVSEYARMLYKSPKTLSNLFAKLGVKTPLHYIHERIAMEARRKLKHSEYSVKEIAFELGFDDIQTFSRFFKRMEGNSPAKYREAKAANP